MRTSFPEKIVIDVDQCNGCGWCVITCPEHAIQLAYVNNYFNDAMVFQDRCICCGACVEVCWAGAIINNCSYEDSGTIGGGGAGGDDGAIISPGGGNPQDPQKYQPSSSDVLSRPNLKPTMPTQLPNACVTAMMEYINQEVCGGNINEGVYILDYLNTYKIYIPEMGVSIENLEPFLSRHFNVLTFSSFSHAIDNGQVIMTDIQSTIENLSHNVLVIGYKINGQLIYMDPEKGFLQQAHASYFKQNYAHPIDGCK